MCLCFFQASTRFCICALMTEDVLLIDRLVINQLVIDRFVTVELAVIRFQTGTLGAERQQNLALQTLLLQGVFRHRHLRAKIEDSLLGGGASHPFLLVNQPEHFQVMGGLPLLDGHARLFVGPGHVFRALRRGCRRLLGQDDILIPSRDKAQQKNEKCGANAHDDDQHLRHGQGGGGRARRGVQRGEGREEKPGQVEGTRGDEHAAQAADGRVEHQRLTCAPATRAQDRQEAQDDQFHPDGSTQKARHGNGED